MPSRTPCGQTIGRYYCAAAPATVSGEPAFGLPLEFPGSVATDLFARQAWWIGAAVATAAAIGLMLFVRASWVIPIGVALPVAPHVIGVPHPPAGAGLVPPELAAAFAARSLGVNATSWALLGRNRGAL